MVSCNCFYNFIIILFGANFALCTEFVPVYIWGTVKPLENVPALHKLSEESFKDTLLEHLKKELYIVVFAEHTLSPEDFAQRSQAGEIAFTSLAKLKESYPISYKPYVQNPIGAIKQLNKPVTELSIGSLLNNPNVPKDNILIIDLNDAREDEHRFHMLKRHDSDIVSIYKDLAERHENILAVYTAHHTSWVAPEEVIHRKTRDILADGDNNVDVNDKRVLLQGDNVILFLNDSIVYGIGDDSVTVASVSLTESFSNETYLIFSLTPDNTSVFKELTFNVRNYSGYWQLDTLSISHVNVANNTEFNISQIFAPLSFSYHCTVFNLNTTDRRINLTLPGLQFQPFYSRAGNITSFGDAYDCIGFTSVPIWSGLFVTAILLLILSFGLTMMMDIKTMDRFDDAKGKTIVINAGE